MDKEMNNVYLVPPCSRQSTDIDVDSKVNNVITDQMPNPTIGREMPRK